MASCQVCGSDGRLAMGDLETNASAKARTVSDVLGDWVIMHP
jgi:hypothetical protein